MKTATKTSKKTVKAKSKKSKVQTEAIQENAGWTDTSKIVPMPEQKAEDILPEIAKGESEATLESVQNDEMRANDEMPEVDLTPNEIADEMTTAVVTWNSKEPSPIFLRENSNVLNRFEYKPQPMSVAGKKTKYSILACSDNGAIVGKPFTSSYGLLNNSDFIGVIESICSVLDKMGLKWIVSTTGTLQSRERSYISLQIVSDGQDKIIIGGREFQAFLNCLNSIPSNSGCTVTFANNTFCVCCRNTFAKVLHDKEGAKFHAAIKHTKGMKAALKDIPLLVEAYFASNAALFEKLTAFSVFPVTLAQAESYFAAFLGRDGNGNLTDKTELKPRSANIAEDLKNLFVNGKGNKGQDALDLFSAVTEYYTHYSAAKVSKTGVSEDLTKQFESSEAGSGYVNKNEFYSWLVKHIQGKADFNGVCKVGDTLLVQYRKNRSEGKFERK